jgi:hypothetical protein
MVVHRRHLPIAEHCEAFVPAPGSADEGGFCERCQQPVHDASAMTEPELRRFLAAREGTRVCLSYHTDARGWIRLRPTPTPRATPPLAVGALALLLAACAGHAVELEAPGPVCRDADGYAIACPEWSEPDMLSTPEVEAPLADRDPEGESCRNGCPVRPTAPWMGHEPPGPDPSADPVGELSKGLTPALGEVPADAQRGTDQFIRGAVMTVEHMTVITIDRGGFVPTAELLQESRERRAERKATRRHWRRSPRTTASR